MTTNHEAPEQQPTQAPATTEVDQILREELDWPFWPVPRPH